MKPHSKSILVFAAFLLVVAAFVAPASRPAQAAGTWYVAPPPTGSDSNDCLTPATPCATINGAIGKAASGDTIKVAVGTYTGTGSEVVLINKSVTLTGGWDAAFASQSGMSTIDGRYSGWGINVISGVTATVERLVVQNAFSTAVYGGGVYNAGALILNNITISRNSSNYGGGGIYNTGTLTLTNNTISDNITGGYGGGGGVYNTGTLVLNNSIISGNEAWGGNGAGLYNSGGTAILNNSTVSANAAGNEGAGGIFNTGSLVLNNTTVSSNMSSNGGGGGIKNNGGVAALYSSTVSGNTSGYVAGGGIYNSNGSVNLQNTIVASNTISSNLPVTSGLDCSGNIGSLGYNLVGNMSGCSFVSILGDLTNVDANLGPLTGSPGYHPLLWGSPAINAGDPGGCKDNLGSLLLIDERGVQRTGRCDIGAYEASLFVNKVVDGAFRPGGLVTYSITVNNVIGSIDLTNVLLTDTLPSQVTYLPNSLSVTNGQGSESGGVISWSGSVFSNTATLVTFGATISNAAVGATVSNTVVSTWGITSASSQTLFDTFSRIYLPLTFNNHCPSFFDDFSYPSSGWPVGEDDLMRSEYLGGEYRILSKNGDYIYLFRSPACARQNYTVEMDARWVGATGDSYGLLFGITSNFSQYYLFDMNTDYHLFRLYQRSPSGFRLIAPVTYSSAIHSGTSSNHLKVTRNGAGIWLEINGTALGVWADAAIMGQTWVGLMSNPYSNVPVSDARFDNFSVMTLGASSTAVEVGEQSATAAEAGASSSLTTLHVTLPSELEWRLPEKSVPQEQR